MTSKRNLLVRCNPRTRCRIYLVDGAQPVVAHVVWVPVNISVLRPVRSAVLDLVRDQILRSQPDFNDLWLI